MLRHHISWDMAVEAVSRHLFLRKNKKNVHKVSVWRIGVAENTRNLLDFQF